MEQDESLGEKRNVNLILRLVLDRSGELERGEVVATRGEPVARFDAWEALTPGVRRILRQVWDEQQ